MHNFSGGAKSGQQGFTLIEIIAVLVILGILSVVAIPKYINLQDEARKSAAKGLIAAAQSQLSMSYSALKLNSANPNIGTPANECSKVAISSGSEGGNVYCGSQDWNANVTINANVTGMTEDVMGTWNSPEAQ